MKKFQRLLSWLLVLTMVLSLTAGLTIGVFAEETVTSTAKTDAGVCGPNVFYQYYDGNPGDTTASGVLTIMGTGPMTDYIKTSTMEVNTPWFKADYRFDIQKIIIVPGVTTVGSLAFFNLTKCTEVVIPEGVTSIGEWAFAYTALQSVALPSTLQSVRHFAFCETDLSLGAKSTCAGYPSIDNEPFGNTSSNAELINDLDSSSIGNIVVDASGLFCEGIEWRYSSASKTLTLSSVYDGQLIDTIYEMKDLSVSGEDCPWKEYAAAIQNVYITKGISNIGQYVFSNLPALKSVTVGEHVTTIEARAFNGATALTGQINLPEATTTVEDWAFGGCTGPITVTTPNTEAEVGDTFSTTGNFGVTYEFAYTGTDTPVNPSAPVGGTCGDNVTWAYDPTTDVLTISGVGSMTNFDTTNPAPWTSFMTDIKTVYVTEGVTTVGSNALNGATSLTSVTLPSTLNIIGNDAFDNTGNIVSAYVDREEDTVTILPNNEDLTDVLVYKGGTTPSTPPSETTSGSCGETATWEYDTNSDILYIKGTGPMYDYTSSDLTPWASYLTEIKMVFVQEGVTTVGQNALNGATAMTGVNMASSVETIGANAFAGCTSLAAAYIDRTEGTVTIQSGNTELVEAPLRYRASSDSDDGSGSGDNTGSGSTGGNEVGGSISGTTLTWTYSPTTHALNIKGTGVIPDYTASNPAPWAIYADEITAITVQDGITRIGNYAFANMTAVIDVYLPKTLTSIGDNAFRDSTALQTIDLPKSLTEIGQSAFRGCSSLQEIVIPAKVTAIANDTFRDCTSLESVEFNNLVNEIGDNAFNGCKALKNIEFPVTLETIGKSAFYGCSGLEGVVISSDLYVKENAFTGCTSLVKVFLDNCDIPEVESGNEPLINNIIDAQASGTLANGVTWVVDRIAGTLTFSGNGEVVREDAWVNEMKYVDTVIFRNGITGVEANLLKSDKNVEHVVMADSVTTIGDSAFELCENLQSVSMSDGLTSMGKNAFKGCSSLTEIDLPDSLTVIPEGAFGSCTSLTKATLGDKVTAIGADAFENCTALKEIEIPATTETIGLGAFKDCTSLELVTLYDGKLKPLQKGIFVGCTGIKTVDFAGSVEAWNTLTANADEELTGAKVEYVVTYTINFVYRGGSKNGQTAWQTLKFNGKPGETVNIEIPYIEHYKASAPSQTYTFGTADDEKTVHYDPLTYTVTVNYVDANGKLLGSSAPISMLHGEKQTHNAMLINGYTPEQDKIEINVDNGNATFEIKYSINQYAYTVEFVSSRTDKVLHSVVYSASYMETVTLTATDFADELAKIKGYTLADATASYTIEKIQDNTQKITVKCDPDSVKVTVNYIGEDGNSVKDKAELDGYFYGDEVTLKAPAIEGMDAVNAEVKVTVDDQTEVTFNYKLKEYKITINFVKDAEGGEKVNEPIVVEGIKHGSKYEFKLADQTGLVMPEGYEVKKDVLTIDSVTEDSVLNVIYTLKKFTVTIYYVDENGERVADPYQQIFDYGTKVSVLSPTVAGHTPDLASFIVDALVKNEEITVKYTRQSFQVTVHFKEEGKDTTDWQVFKDFTVTVKYGESYTFDLADHPEYVAAAYTTDKLKIEFGEITEDVEGTITYTPKKFTLTVNYVTADGTLVDTKEYSVTAGRSFDIPKWEHADYKTVEEQTITIGVTENPVKEIKVEANGTSVDPGTQPNNPNQGTENPGTENPGTEDPDTNPGDNEKPNNAGKVALVIAIIVLVLGGGGAAFYFLYMKKPF